MTQRQAWLFIASRFSAYARARRPGAYTVYGLCFALRKLAVNGMISWNRKIAMGVRLRRYMRSVGCGEQVYIWPTQKQFAALRAKLARRLASGK